MSIYDIELIPTIKIRYCKFCGEPTFTLAIFNNPFKQETIACCNDCYLLQRDIREETNVLFKQITVICSNCGKTTNEYKYVEDRAYCMECCEISHYLEIEYGWVKGKIFCQSCYDEILNKDKREFHICRKYNRFKHTTCSVCGKELICSK